MHFKLLFLLLISHLIISCSPVITSSNKATNTILQYKMKEAFQTWEKNAIKQETSYTDAFYEKFSTWIDNGLRYNYAILNEIASISILETAVGEKIFLSGPHEKELNFYATKSFGYYNPAFIAKASKVIDYSLTNDSMFKQLGKYVYDRQLQKMTRLYHQSYQYLKANPAMTQQLMADYRAAMQNGNEAGELIQSAFRSFADEKEELGRDWYVANTAPGFWIRRMMDGTADQIHEVLEKVMTTYDKEML
ncbi:MAG: hypothetical protein HC912_09890 [Saprospiraceae bacterium]|nr:hypothetical protein [Saprospiraceae bacterium]